MINLARGRIYDVEVTQTRVDFVFDYKDVGNISNKAYVRIYYQSNPDNALSSQTLNYSFYDARDDLFFDQLVSGERYILKLEDDSTSMISAQYFSTDPSLEAGKLTDIITGKVACLGVALADLGVLFPFFL